MSGNCLLEASRAFVFVDPRFFRGASMEGEHIESKQCFEPHEEGPAREGEDDG